MCPVGALEPLVTGHLSGWHIFAALALTVVLTLLVGKAFCAWVCPTSWVKKALGPKRQKHSHADSGVEKSSDPACKTSCAACSGSCALAAIGGKRDGIRLDSRHAVLAGAVASSALFGFPVFCLVCPVGLSIATVASVWHLLQFNEITWGLVAFPAVVIIEVVVFKKWCSTLCPISALLSLISSGNKTLRPQVDPQKCLRAQGSECSVCVSVCPERVDPHSASIPECSKCGECIDACPAQAISLPLLRKRS